MTKKYKCVDMIGAKRHIVVLTDDPFPIEQKEARRQAFLHLVFVDGLFQGLLNCGPLPFEILRMQHDGRAWFVEMETVEKET
jgi:hypothetical protein